MKVFGRSLAGLGVMALLWMAAGCVGNSVPVGTINTDSVVIEDLVQGTGTSAISRTPVDQTQAPLTCVLVCNYTGQLRTSDSRNGEVFSTSFDRGGPVRVLLGTASRLTTNQQAFVAKQNVVGVSLFDGITGVQIGMQGMQAGGTRRITVPPSLATPLPSASNLAQPLIPANTTLVYTVQLLQVIPVPTN